MQIRAEARTWGPEADADNGADAPRSPDCPVGAENRVTVSDQRVHGDLTVTVQRQPSMIARYGLRTHLPDACSRAELAGAARPLRCREGRRDPGAASRGRHAAPKQP